MSLPIKWFCIQNEIIDIEAWELMFIASSLQVQMSSTISNSFYISSGAYLKINY